MFQLSLILGAGADIVRYGAESGESDYSVWLQVCRGYDRMDYLAGFLWQYRLCCRKSCRLGSTVHLCILGVAAAMIFLYNSPGKNIFLNIGLGLMGFL